MPFCSRLRGHWLIDHRLFGAAPGSRSDDRVVHDLSGDAVLALGTNTVYAVETPDGGWGEVRAIDDLLEQGLHMPAYRIRFASGHAKVATGEGIFRVERDVDARND